MSNYVPVIEFEIRKDAAASKAEREEDDQRDRRSHIVEDQSINQMYSNDSTRYAWMCQLYKSSSHINIAQITQQTLFICQIYLNV
jgi:hypothetical protein